MERSEHKRLSHKLQSKTSNKKNGMIKVNSVLKNKSTMENVSQQQSLNLNNNKISIIQNLPM